MSSISLIEPGSLLKAFSTPSASPANLVISAAKLITRSALNAIPTAPATFLTPLTNEDSCFCDAPTPLMKSALLARIWTISLACTSLAIFLLLFLVQEPVLYLWPAHQFVEILYVCLVSYGVAFEMEEVFFC